VLVVEHDPVVRDRVVEVLGDLGDRTLDATDGPSGLRASQSKRRTDLLVSDVGLPGMDGREMVEQARAARPGRPVPFITGYAENAMFGVGALEPGIRMMTKPFAVEALALRTRGLIRG
jgi:CheY-like chemotaxis protein